MELWIRSQDGEVLGKAKEIVIDEKEKQGEIIINNYIYGTYATKERALEVLDEIQNIIIGKYMTNLSFEASFSKFDDDEEARKALIAMAVYEMPKE